MSTKAPIYLKRGSRKGKLRDLLSPDMISPPLGDFRHTIHIGSGEGDVFGDMSFLQGKFHLLPRSNPGSPASSPCRTQPQSHSELPSPLLKNAISLPVIGGPQALSLPQAPPPKPPRLHLDETSKIPLKDVGGVQQAIQVTSHNPITAEKQEEEILGHAGSLLSLHVDLGPSILEDVLQIMEKV
ncbi:cdc42 effector protein 2 [Spea bombifrons]|uniref:cdc42 effector protein 2 n=1 Tax=Spea bombifrons TaxID=233779 RepID=UPI00234A1DB9|nr:cdc42 effector protein 2 [Spea bombifrons]